MVRWSLAVTAATLCLWAQNPIPDFTPPTPLFRAVLGNNTPDVKRLLDAGADPNEARFVGGATTLIAALMQQNPGIAKMLIDKGADVHATDGLGSTTLMWATMNETGDDSIVEELLRRGVDPNASNKAGDTALSWALRRGHTPAVRALREHGVSDRKLVTDAVERALGLLEKSAPQFVKVSGCTSCHNQSLPQMAIARAKQKGIAVDAQVWDKQAKSVIAMFKPVREMMLQGKDNIPNPAISVSYLLIGLGESGYAPDETTEAMAHLVATRQSPDGSFVHFGARPPMESSGITATALSLRALQMYGKDAGEKIDKAREWLSTAQPHTTEEQAMQLLGLTWAKADPDVLKPLAKSLMASQRPEGGWGQLPTLESDAYATGQALVALNEAGQIGVRDEVYARGAGFLLRTQRPDGSWLVRSRSVPFQPYKESGFPHGKDQWISAAGSGWAAMALTLSLPNGQQLSQSF